MPLRVLDATTDAAQWLALLERVPGAKDIYFHPEYLALHRFSERTKALLFVFELQGDVWLYPFLLTPIDGVDDCECSPCDIESPYGYSGPLSSTDVRVFLAAAHDAFSGWCRSLCVVAEFVRLHPLLANERWLDRQVDLVVDRETVSLNLETSASDFGLAKKALYMIRRAERVGASAIALNAPKDFQRFVDLYRETMKRLGASEFYMFNEQYFNDLNRLVAKCGFLFASLGNDLLLTASVFLKGTRWLHYHLSASQKEQSVPGIANLVIFAGAQYGRQLGLRRLHLGGGRTRAADDSLLRFKESMATERHVFYVGKRIHDRDRYAALRDQWSRRYPDLVQSYGGRLLCYRYTT